MASRHDRTGVAIGQVPTAGNDGRVKESDGWPGQSLCGQIPEPLVLAER